MSPKCPPGYGVTDLSADFTAQGVHQQVAFAGAGKLGFPEAAVFAFALGGDLIHVAREAMIAIGL